MPPNQDPYGFIMNPGTNAPKKNMLPSTMNKKHLMIFGGAGLVILAILATLVVSLINSGPTNKDQLLVVAAKQSELIRVSELALKEATGTQARNLAMTTKLSVRSDQSTLTAALKSQKVKIPKPVENAKTTQLLTEARQNNRFDTVYLEFIQDALVDYQKSLNTAYRTTVSAQLKETMKAQYENASLIIGVDPEV